MSKRGLDVAEKLHVAEGLGRGRPSIALRLLIALAAALIVGCFTASGAQADCTPFTPDYPLVSKTCKATTIHTANRPFDIPIDSIMIHDTEGSWQSAIDVFTGQTVSAAHYLVSGQVDATDPEVTQARPQSRHARSRSRSR